MLTFWHLLVAHLQAFVGFWSATLHDNMIGLAFLALATVWASMTLNFSHVDDTRETK